MAPEPALSARSGLGPTYAVHREVFAAHPSYRRGVVVVRDADNGRDGTALRELLRTEEEGLRVRIGAGNVAEHPRIAAWRDAYRRFGAKPSEHRSSVEAMTRRVVKPDSLPSINPLVDIGNIVSLRFLVPAGVHPLAAASLELRPTRANDRFLPPDGGAAEAPAPCEIVLCQGGEVLTRRWTWRQAAGTQTGAQTSAVFFNVDALPPVSDDELREAMRDIERLVAAHAGGRIALAAVLSAEQPTMAMPA